MIRFLDDEDLPNKPFLVVSQRVYKIQDNVLLEEDRQHWVVAKIRIEIAHLLLGFVAGAEILQHRTNGKVLEASFKKKKDSIRHRQRITYPEQQPSKMVQKKKHLGSFYPKERAT